METGYMMLSFCLIVMMTIFMGCECNKYAEKINAPPPSPPKKEFRMNRVNMVWEKAQRSLYGQQLNDLYADLKYQDELEHKVKKMQGEGMDKDGSKAAEVRKKFMGIMKQYGLDNRERPAPPDSEFTDPKLARLWMGAQLSGFDEEELKTLKEEFRHQQDKMTEFKMQMDELRNVHGDKRLEKDDPKWEEFNTRNLELKSKHKEIGDGLKELEAKVTPPTRGDEDFQDERVNRLWAQAKKANMTERELNSFKEELRHFDIRVQKHKHFAEQAEKSKQHFDGKKIPDKDYPEKHKQIEEKAKHFEAQVKKHEQDMQKRLDKLISEHSEL